MITKLTEFKKLNEKKALITDKAKPKKNKMHKILGIPEDKEIQDIYTSGTKLAKDLVAKVGKKKANGMLAFAANIDKTVNVFDKAHKALAKIEEAYTINEAVNTADELASFLNKESSHFAAFLKPKRFTAITKGDNIVEVKPASGSFTITVDFSNSTINTTGKPEYPESVSYTEIMEYIKITKFAIIDESANKIEEGYDDQGHYQEEEDEDELYNDPDGDLDGFNPDSEMYDYNEDDDYQIVLDEIYRNINSAIRQGYDPKLLIDKITDKIRREHL